MVAHFSKLFIVLLVLVSLLSPFTAYAKDVYSLFGKLFLSGRVEYDFTDTRDFLADVEEQEVEQNSFDFDRVFRRGFHSVLIIEETAGNVKNILSLGDIPTTYTKFSFDRVDLSGVRWDVRATKTDWTFLMLPGPVNPIIGQEEVDSSGIGLREVTKLGKSKLGLSWFFRETPVLSADIETNFANYGLKAEFASTPKGAIKRDLQSRFDATATVFKAFRTIGDTILQGAAYRVGSRYDASRSVGDNDDQDRYTDNTFLDPPSRIIPGDLDKNDNGIFDYEDDILLFDVDEDFLDESDQNNNGIRDQEENDREPDYEFDVGLRGARLALKRKTSRRGSSTDLDIGLQYEKDMRLDAAATKAFANIVYQRDLPKIGSVLVENELKYVKDRIPDETWYFAGFLNREEEVLYRELSEVQGMEKRDEIAFFPVRGGVELERRLDDPSLMQNDLINTAKVTFEHKGFKRFVTTARAKLQYDLDFDGDNEHYEVGILKVNYRMRPSKSLEVSPMFKFTARNGFKMTEDHPQDLLLTGLINEEDVSFRVRLRQIDQAHVRDVSPALIFKVVYQFTKTIKITSGLQLLLFRDLFEDTNDFVRQAILAEMEKNFVAYERDLFLHIGVRYIDQRAKGDVNDRNFMETFVRVYAKF